MGIVRWVLCRLVQFIFDEVIFGNHLDVGVVGIDVDRPTKSYSYRSVSRK